MEFAVCLIWYFQWKNVFLFYLLLIVLRRWLKPIMKLSAFPSLPRRLPCEHGVLFQSLGVISSTVTNKMHLLHLPLLTTFIFIGLEILEVYTKAPNISEAFKINLLELKKMLKIDIENRILLVLRKLWPLVPKLIWNILIVENGCFYSTVTIINYPSFEYIGPVAYKADVARWRSKQAELHVQTYS